MNKPKTLSLRSWWIFILMLLFGNVSCSNDNNGVVNPPKRLTVTEAIDEVMKEWYLWNDQLPDLNSSLYSDPNQYFESLLVQQDKWSFIANLDALMAFFQNGTYTGYGFGVEYDQNDEVRVSLVYEASKLNDYGITRGWKLAKINGNDTKGMSESTLMQELNHTPNLFLFENNNGEQKEVQLYHRQMNQNTVLHHSVLPWAGKKVAYLVFDSFLDSSEAELNEAFSEFSAEGAEELILDLRYNGGGSNLISNQLAALITGNAHTDEVYSKIFHNKDKTENDTVERFIAQSAAYAFDRIFVITSSGTASASEMVINGLKPYLGKENVILVGTRTHGKPAGMYIFPYESINLAVVPISFKITNKNDEGDYFDGIPVDYEIADDVIHDWGDPEEADLQAVLYYIQNEGFEPTIAAKAGKLERKKLPLKGFKELIGAF